MALVTNIDKARLAQAAALSAQHHGPELGCFVPGMFVYDGRRGRYPAVSITGPDCALNCGHCQGQLLAPMKPTADPKSLIAAAHKAWAKGAKGLLVSGGCDLSGKLPLERFASALARIKAETDLILSVHTGFADEAQAKALKAAGVDLVMLDIIGHPETAARVYNLTDPQAPARSLSALVEAGLEVAPHLVVGLDGGRIKGESEAVDMIAASGAPKIVFVVFMPLKGTALAGCEPPQAEEVIELIIDTRFKYPALPQHLGCAKPRGRYHRRLDKLAVRAGVNHLAIPAPEAVDLAEEIGRPIKWSETCCTVGHLVGQEKEETAGETKSPASFSK